jgi:hypothetical protein
MSILARLLCEYVPTSRVRHANEHAPAPPTNTPIAPYSFKEKLSRWWDTALLVLFLIGWCAMGIVFAIWIVHNFAPQQ